MSATAAPTDADALRLRHEFLSLPNLRLTADDVVALLQLQRRHALLILESLVQEGFLARTSDGYFVRPV